MELYPYPTGSGYPMMFLPSEANEGGPAAIMERLRDPKQRRAIAARIDEMHGDGLMSVGVFTHCRRRRTATWRARRSRRRRAKGFRLPGRRSARLCWRRN